VTDLVQRWYTYAQWADHESTRMAKYGDKFGASLCAARGAVRKAAADLLRDTTDPLEAARLMHQRAMHLRQSDMPLIGFDTAAVRYTEARTWQDCARTLDPALPEVQPLWD
jgi:hypothetical protein